MNCILIKFIRRVHQFIDQTVEWSSNTAANSCGCLPSVVIIASCGFALTVLAYTCLNRKRNSVILGTSPNDKTTEEKPLDV